MTFQTPWALLLLLLAVLPWLTRGGALRRWQRVMRSLLIAVVVLALAQPALLHHDARPVQVIVLDQRAALAPALREQARQRVQQRLQAQPRDALTRVVQLGGEALDDARASTVLLGDGSLTTALSIALQQLPGQGGGQLVLVSDGRSDDAGWGREVAALLARGVTVSVDALERVEGTARLAAVRAPDVRAGERVQLHVQIHGVGDRLRVRVLRAGAEVARSDVFDTHGGSEALLEFVASEAGFHTLSVVLEHADAGSAPPVAQATYTLAVQEPLQVLHVGPDAAAADRLQQLVGTGFHVTHAGTTDAPPPALGGQPLLMLDGTAPAQLSDAWQQQIGHAVKDGGSGLLFSGGASAFSGLAAETAKAGTLEMLLPVQGQPQEQMQDPSVALVVIIDTSGSMAGAPMDLAKQIARLAVRRLKPEDRVGIVEFYGARQWSVPIQPARDTAEVERAIGRMQAQGGTQLFPAIQEAYFGLKNTDARFKHMLVITDAGVEEDNYQRLLRHIAQDRINVSTALVGNGDGEQRMSELANWGRGRFYQVADEASMVELNLKQPQLQPSPGYRQGSFPVQVRDAQQWWSTSLLQGMPPLRGLAQARVRDGAQVLASSGDAPLLATWQYGAGRVTSLMTEPLGAGTRAWQNWPGHGAWLARVLLQTARQHPAQALRVERDGDVVRVLVEDHDPAAKRELALVTDAGREQQLQLEPRAPGLFEARTRLDQAQAARVLLRSGGTTLRAAADAPLGPMTLPMQALAGMSAATPAPVDDWSVLELWPWLARLAIALYLIDVLCRRWPWPVPAPFRKTP